ncbi:uncharacterized protein KY384_006392 [Bacidia gigantensis]|uniref:uncharacterized protein n=1 Tax=Bacidia gigantensis TaxID=2732470 RepID=UPI001D04709C|nr:uncharacterized protein KY384_006392 [Bacidia gigantensis]KAG8528705.1 hypothetical protein KY384_006392 [Bacidia gigantensis]
MNLSHIINSNHHRSQEDFAPRSAHRHSDPYPRRLRDYKHEEMATALTARPYRSPSPVYRRPYPPSPPLDDIPHLRTLPSIQSLINMDNSRPGSVVDGERDSVSHLRSSPPLATTKSARRPQSYSQPIMSKSDIRPPSPPIDPQLGLDGPLHSPASSQKSSATASHYSGGTYQSLDPAVNRQRSPPSISNGNSIRPQSPQAAFQGATYPDAPTSNTNYTYSQVSTSENQSMYQQRPLPNTFPPAAPVNANPATPKSDETSPVEVNGQWQHQHQHHHYIAPSASASFPGQTSDRYVCHVCNKAFSRPSSLRIHSHSHTGEKPFICPHKGCGKAFSVRSNMKRHERGCHGSTVQENL